MSCFSGRRAGPGRAIVLAIFTVWLGLGVLGGCSDNAPPPDPDAVTGKTPVIRPEDVKGRSVGDSVVLAPDYRRELVPETPPETAATEPGAARLFAAKRPAAATAATVSAPAVASNAATGRPAATPSPAAPAVSTSGVFPQAGCRQLVVVTASDFAASRGMLRRLTRDGTGGPWRQDGESVPCALGRRGLGVGRGLPLDLDGPAKREGDGRTPAGLFSLPEAFGYAGASEATAKGVRLPYAVVTDRSACVTDPDSSLFGRVVGPGERGAGAVGRQDRMWRTDRANVWGVVIGHNRTDPAAKAGTCLFLNVRPAGGGATGGSIGLPEPAAAALAAWLDPAAEPLLLVVPESVYQALRPRWKLP